MFNFFKKNTHLQNTLKDALSKTKEFIGGSVFDSFEDNYPNEYELEDLEYKLIKADLGVDFSSDIIDRIKKEKIKSKEVRDFIKKEFSKILDNTGSEKLKFDKDKLNIYFVVGVNGAGKTTLISKLANLFKAQGERVLLAAGDTFRAAAEEQLDIWAKRVGVDILREDKAQSAAVIYKAIDKANLEHYNVLIVDSAGRLENKYNLVEELKKMKNVILKKLDNNNLETILVLDGTQGQNGLNQARVFNENIDITSVAITKLDGTPKGGIILSVARDLNIPTKLVSLGENIEDIREFDKNDFIEALFSE